MSKFIDKVTLSTDEWIMAVVSLVGGIAGLLFICSGVSAIWALFGVSVITLLKWSGITAGVCLLIFALWTLWDEFSNG